MSNKSIGSLLFICIALLALFIGIPRYLDGMTTQEMSVEPQVYLKDIFRNQQEYFSEHQVYAQTFDGLGWKAGRSKMEYTYFFSPDSFIRGNSWPGPPVASAMPCVGQTEYSIVAVGNIDHDPAPDVWVMNEKGELVNVESDLGN